jgi:hypothetical protein
MKQILSGVLLVLVGVFIWASLHGEETIANNQRFQAFVEKRKMWHQNCDIYVNKPLKTEEAKACQAQLVDLIAYAKAQGW